MRLLSLAAVPAVALAVLAVPTATASAEPSVDPCSVMSEQAAGKLRTLAGPMLPDVAKDLPDSVIVTVARAKAKCTGAPPKLSEAELNRRLCALATVEELKKLGARLGAADQAKEKATPDNVKAIRARLGCDTATTSPSPTKPGDPTKPTAAKPSGSNNGSGSSGGSNSSRLPTGKGGGYSQVGDRDVPTGSIATGG